VTHGHLQVPIGALQDVALDPMGKLPGSEHGRRRTHRQPVDDDRIAGASSFQEFDGSDDIMAGAIASSFQDFLY
jgi:hypothetical protein